MKRFTVIFSSYLAAIFLMGCVRVLPEDPLPSKKIVLTPHLTQEFQGKDDLGSLIIDKPLMLESLDSRRLKIVFQDDDGVSLLDVIAGVEWRDKLPPLLQETLIKLYEETGKFTAVGKSEENFQAAYRLKMTLTNFEIVKDDKASLTVNIGFSAKIIHVTTQKVLSQQRFSQKISVAEEKLSDIIASFEKATSVSFSDMIAWTIEKTREVTR